MNVSDFGLILVGLLLGWATKIPVFLHLYREWEEERDTIRRWMQMQDQIKREPRR